MPTVTQAGALMFGSPYFILIKYQLAVKLTMLELMFVCVCVCVCVCVLVSIYRWGLKPEYTQPHGDLCHGGDLN